MRLVFIFIICLAISFGAVAVGYGGFWVWTNVSDTGQRLAAEGDLGAFGALYLAVVAAIVALVAYQAASQRPKLKATIKFRDSEANKPLLPFSDSNRGNQLLDLDRAADLTARIALTNTSKFPARSPYIRLALVNLAGLPEQKDWSVVETGSAAGATEIEWEGRDRSVHDVRELHPVSFTGVRMLRGAPEYAIKLHVSAEGFAKTFEVPITLIPRDDWIRRMAGRHH